MATVAIVLGVIAAGFLVLAPKGMNLRAAVALFLLTSSSLSFFGVSGGFPFVVLLFALRDAALMARAWSPARSVSLLCAMTLPYVIQPEPFALRVGAGVLLAWYLGTAVKQGALVSLAWGGYLGAILFAVRNLTAPAIASADHVGGTVVVISRRILPGLDPNASAGLLLLGVACGTLLCSSRRGFQVPAIIAGVVIMLCSIALMATRYAMIAGAATLIFLWLSRGTLWKKLAALAMGGVAANYLLPVFIEGASFARFAKAANDADRRASIYGHWWELVTQDNKSLLFGLQPDVIARQAIAPHNSLLEAAAHFGAFGLVVTFVAVASLLLPAKGTAWQLRVGALAVLGLSMIVGLLGQYLPWVALVLLNAQPARAEPQPHCSERPHAGVGIRERAPRGRLRANWLGDRE